MFVVRELVGMNVIQLLVMVQNPRKLVSDLSRLVQMVISDMIPSLGFVTAFDDGGSGQNFQRGSVGVFLSYRWTGSFDADLTLGLFNNRS
jgi:hypothetical protein